MNNVESGEIRVAIAGVGGFWTGRNHAPALLEMKSDGKRVRLSTVFDNRMPGQISNLSTSTRDLLYLDNPAWGGCPRNC